MRGRQAAILLVLLMAASFLPAMAADERPILPGAARFRYRREIPAAPPGLTVLQLDAAVLSHSPGLKDLRIVDARGRQVPYLLEQRGEPLSLTLPAPVRRMRKEDPPSLSRYWIELPYPSLPAAQLILSTSARVFERELQLVDVPDTNRERRERTVAQASWRHADPETSAPPLTLDLPAISATRFDLLVEEGDNAPLPLNAPRLLLPANRLRFFYPEDAQLKLLYGQPGLPPPRYDLSLLAPRLQGEAAHEITLGPEFSQGSKPDAIGSEKKIFWGALVAAVLVLLLVLGRMLRPERHASGS